MCILGNLSQKWRTSSNNQEDLVGESVNVSIRWFLLVLQLIYGQFKSSRKEDTHNFQEKVTEHQRLKRKSAGCVFFTILHLLVEPFLWGSLIKLVSFCGCELDLNKLNCFEFVGETKWIIYQVDSRIHSRTTILNWVFSFCYLAVRTKSNYMRLTCSSTPLWASTLGQGFLALPCSSSTLGTIL